MIPPGFDPWNAPGGSLLHPDPPPRSEPASGCCGKEIGGILDAFATAVELKFHQEFTNDKWKVWGACEGKDTPWGWDINDLYGDSKNYFSCDGCGTNGCRGTVQVHGQCHWASDVNYFMWGLTNRLCRSALETQAWSDGMPPWTIGLWTEGFAVRRVYSWRSITFPLGDGTTRGRVAWTRAGYNIETTVPSPLTSKCKSCGKEDAGALSGHFGDWILPLHDMIYIP